jgi:amidohydrolase
LAIFNFADGAQENSNAKTVVFRCELDAIPVEEKNEFRHVSTNKGVSHKCGHDGHMAIVAGLAMLLSDHYQPESGRVVLLFQPAEETGAGAQQMVDSPNKVLAEIVNSLNTSIFALHNVPGFPSGSVVLPRGNSFASASKGIHIKLSGATSHASQPHLGRNPAPAMCNIVQALLSMPTLYIPYDQKALVTIVGARAGEKAFGVSAGDAEVMATLRATTDVALKILEDKAKSLVHGYATTYGLTYTIGFEDAFAATINNPDRVSIVQNVAKESGLEIFWMDEAFPWSEDFGIFLQRVKGAMFGLGVGEKHEPLHGEYYDFPDNEIVNGVKMFANILLQTLSQN